MKKNGFDIREASPDLAQTQIKALKQTAFGEDLNLPYSLEILLQ